MKIGMNLLLWTTNVTREHFPVLADLKQTGFDGVEIPLMEGDRAQYQEIRTELDRLGLECTAVTALDEDSNPVSPDASVRAAAVKRMSWALDMCDVLGSKMLCGPFHSAYKTFTDAPPTEDEKRWCADTLRDAAEDAAGRDIQLAVEFLNRFECYIMNTSAQADEIVRMADHPSLGILYDTHHANIEEKSVSGAIDTCGANLIHVHISENDRGTPGRGQVAWDESFKALRGLEYDSWLVIESFSRLDTEFANAIHIWRDLAGSVEEVYREGLKFIQEKWAS
jgi:D-psicose/D-tagatose/L-ribulose 3-epimerase